MVFAGISRRPLEPANCHAMPVTIPRCLKFTVSPDHKTRLVATRAASHPSYCMARQPRQPLQKPWHEPKREMPEIHVRREIWREPSGGCSAVDMLSNAELHALQLAIRTEDASSCLRRLGKAPDSMRSAMVHGARRKKDGIEIEASCWTFCAGRLRLL